MPRRRSAPPQRDGNPGGARYDNRTDLAMEGGSQPVRTPTGQPYGQAQALTEAQQAMPLPEAPAPPMAPPGAQRMPGTMTPVAAQGYRLPNLGLTQPSQRPDEPITAGINRGPGPGAPRRVGTSVGAMLAALAAATDDPLLAQLADIADTQGI